MRHRNYGLQLPGRTSNGVKITETEALSPSGDQEFIACFFAPRTLGFTIADKTWIGANVYTFSLAINNAGLLQLTTSPDGTSTTGNAIIHLSTETVGLTGMMWIRATIDVDDGAGNHIVRFYKSTSQEVTTEPTDWVQVGDDVTTAGTTSVFPTTQPIVLGGALQNAFAPNTGTFYRFIRKNGIDGTPVIDIDFTKQIRDASSFTDDAGRTVNIQTSGTPVAYIGGRTEIEFE